MATQIVTEYSAPIIKDDDGNDEWVHPSLIIGFMQWLSPQDGFEFASHCVPYGGALPTDPTKTLSLEWSGCRLLYRDGLYDLTDLCRQGRLSLEEYLKLESTEAYLGVAAQFTGLSRSDLLQKRKGPSGTHIWSTAPVAISLACSLNPKMKAFVHGLFQYCPPDGSTIAAPIIHVERRVW